MKKITNFKNNNSLSLDDYGYPASRWIFLVASILLASATAFYTYSGVMREKQQLLRGMEDRAHVLMWALEGSARSMGHMRARFPLTPSLVQEVANQPGISYICLVDSKNNTLIHSEPQKAESQYSSDLADKRVLDPAELVTRIISQNNIKIFEVSKRFTPSIIHNHMRFGRGMGMGKHHMRRSLGAEGPEQDPLYLVVGIDARDFDAALSTYTQHAILISSLILMVGLSVFALMYFIQNYRYSTRLLQDTRAMASQIVTNLPIGLISTKTNGQITLLNDYCEELLALTDKYPKYLKDLPFLDWDSILNKLDTGHEIFEQEMEIPINTTNSLAISLSALAVKDSNMKATGFLFIIRDLGEVRKLQKQIRLNERLSALGNMAAGVAHEIRNPLSSVKGYALFLSTKLKDDEKAYDTAQLMIKEIDRLNRVVTDLLVVARPGDLRLEAIEPSQVIDRCVRLIEQEASSKNIKISKMVEQGVGKLLADQDKLVQSLLNILLNSVQAIKEESGEINISAGLSEKRLGESHIGQRESDAIVIRIRDNGQGMSEKNLSNIFTPYFTTKASGSGLGMTITHQIIEQHRGEITVASQEGKGTVFTIRLPKADTKKEV